MSALPDALIVGGGIVGASIARAFREAGLRVSIVEARMIGGASTAAGMGHLVVMDDSEAQFALTHYSRRLWDALLPEAPANLEYERTGTLWVAADEAELAAVRPKLHYYQERGVAAELLDPEQLYAAEPHLAPGLAGGLRIPEDGVIYAPAATRWLAREIPQQIAEVARLEEQSVILRNGDKLSAGLIVCATGIDAPRFFPGLAVQPRKGHLAITDRYPDYVRHQLVELGYLKSAHSHGAESVAFNIQPRQTGQLLIGSSRQYGARSTDVESQLLARMLQRALTYLPGLRQLNIIRTWTGFRAATPDKLPIIGLAPGARSLYLATGHEGLGITTALATAALLTDEILGRASAIDRSPYAATRSSAWQN